MLSVAQNYAAYVAYAEPVYEHPSRLYGFGGFKLFFGDLNNASVSRYQDIFLGYSQLTGESRVFHQMLLLAVKRDKVFGLNNAHHKLKLFLAGVTGNVNVVHTLVNHVCAALHKLVNNLAYKLFITGNRSCRNDKHIAGYYFNLPVIRKGDTVKRRERLALTARCYNNKLIGRIIPNHFNIDKHVLRKL